MTGTMCPAIAAASSNWPRNHSTLWSSLTPCPRKSPATPMLSYRCTWMEHHDDLRSTPERVPTLALRMPAFPPRFDSKPAWWIAKGLAEKLELGKYFPWQDYREVLDWQLRQVGTSLEEMEQIGGKMHRLQGLYRRLPL